MIPHRAESFLVIQYSKSSSAGQISPYSDTSNKNPEEVLSSFFSMLSNLPSTQNITIIVWVYEVRGIKYSC